MADDQLVIAVFDDEAAADAAVEALKRTRAFDNDAMAVLVLDEDGKLKTNNVGTTSGVKGATGGLVLGLLGPVGLGVGTVAGALVGKLHHKNLGLEDGDRERLGAALRGGKAAVGIVAVSDQVVPVQSILVGLGGTTEAHEFEEAKLREAVNSAGPSGT
jgi:uncharacterized membrane protein